eukprot:3343158-Pyramimonas_sp.AAC.1
MNYRIGKVKGSSSDPTEAATPLRVKKQKGVKEKDGKKAKVDRRARGPDKGPKLDRRMFADKRGQKAAAKKQGKKGGKGGRR